MGHISLRFFSSHRDDSSNSNTQGKKITFRKRERSELEFLFRLLV